MTDKPMTDNPTIIHPDVDKLWEKHRSVIYGSFPYWVMDYEDFKAALNEAQQRERWEYWSAKCAELQAELSKVDEVLSRREAVDRIPDRVGKIERALERAGEVAELQAEVERLKGEID